MFAHFISTVLQFLILSIISTAASDALLATGQGEVKSQTIQFNNNTMFADLSQYNFWSGLNNTYEYTLQARVGHKVRLYFYTPLAGNAVVDVYDGSDDAGAKFNLSAVDALNYATFYTPLNLKSTTGSLFIRIRAFNQNSNAAVQDFQALATDYENPAGCDALVMASQDSHLVLNPSFAAAALPGTSCLNIIHATDTSNNAMKTMNIRQAKGDYTVFKGLNMNYLTQLPTDVAKPIYAFDKHIIVKHSSVVSLETVWFIHGDNEIDLTLSSTTPVMLMSPDFYAYDMLQFSGKQLTEQFVIQPIKGENIGAEVHVQMLLGTGVVQISAVNGQDKSLLLTLNNIRNFPYVYKYEHTFDKLLVTYTNNVTDSHSAYGSGMIGTVRPGGVQNGSNACSLLLPLIIFLGIKFL